MEEVIAYLEAMGQAGKRLDSLHAVEASAGNISICTKQNLNLAASFSNREDGVPLPVKAEALSGYIVFVTGSGCRLRDVLDVPFETVSAFKIDESGENASWYYNSVKRFSKPTSEFNSHLAVHNDQVARRGVEYQALIHAQPPHLVFLSHIDELRNNANFNRAITRWEPETIVQLPGGIEVLDYMVPGSQELMENNVRGLQKRVMTLWSRHGIMVRSDKSPLDAVDKIEYVETGATYEILNRCMSGVSTGLSKNEISAVIDAFGVETDLY